MNTKLAIILLAIAATTASAANAQRGRPVMIGADTELDACPSTGEVRGLDRRGQNYLSVRAAPSQRAHELARIGRGQIVWICDVSAGPGWYGVVYRRGGNRRCGLGHVRRMRPYAGPCASGWVSARYVTIIAG